MIQRSVFMLTVLSAVGCGLVGGVFFAFSTFVMKALSRLPAEQGIAAMQSINITVLNPLFLVPSIGTTCTCLALGVYALSIRQRPGAGLLLAGSLLYVIGTILVTMAFNVPRNEVLKPMPPASAEAAAYWANYLQSWTMWNHVRTTAALIASALLMLALKDLSPSNGG